MSAPSTVHLAYGVAFATVAALASWRWLHYTALIVADRQQASPAKPRVTKEQLMAILAEVALASEAAVRVMDAAMRAAPGGAAASPADKLALEESRAYLLIADLEEIEEAARARAGVSQADLDAAFAYYNSGPGRDRKVIDAAASMRRALGKHLLTKKRSLGLIRDMFLHSLGAVDDIAATVVAAVEGGRDAMAAMQTAPLAVATEFMQARCGLSMEEVMARVQLLGRGDDAFRSQLGELLEKGQAALNQAMMQNETLSSMFGGGGM